MKATAKVVMPASEMIEGSEAWDRFTKTMKHVISVPHAEIQKRIEAHRAEVAKNPDRRGPKRKVKPSASPASGV
jgi:hypothetical protein